MIAPWERRLERALRELLDELGRQRWLAITNALHQQSSTALYDGMFGKSTQQIKSWLLSLDDSAVAPAAGSETGRA
jgi:hypothetical protein